MPKPTSLHYDYVPGEDLALLDGDRVLWRYRFNTDRRKPFFHPVRTTRGVLLTCFEPWDHWWHRGLWFSWQFINGVNYWEEDIDDGTPKGSLQFVSPEAVLLAPEAAGIVTHYNYIPPEGGAVMEDRREISIGLPRPDGHYVMDWKLSFTALADVVIDRHAITPERDWGGYSGLSWRSARSMGKFQRLNAEGQAHDDTQHQRAAWVDLTGHSDGGRDLVGGIAFFDHPSNPRYPSYWKTFGQDGFGYINPAFVMMEPYPLAAGMSLDLRYRVLVHDGALELAELEKEAAAFAEVT